MRRAPNLEAARPSLTPLIDIAFLVLIFFMALPLKRLDGKLEAWLPQAGGQPRLADRPPPVPVRIHLRRRGDDVHYRIGDFSFDRPEGMAPLIRRLGNESTYELRSDAGVPWRAVVRTVDVLKALDCTRLQFHGTRRASRQIRQLVPLPQPGSAPR